MSLRSRLPENPSRVIDRRSALRLRAVIAAILPLALMSSFAVVVLATPVQAADPCTVDATSVACENSKPGSPATEWDVAANSDTIEGFAGAMSVNVDEEVVFKVSTDASAYTLDVYRMGYYGGDGARRVASLTPSAALPQTQPACLEEAATGLVDCGNWSDSASWRVPADAVSGVYFVHLKRPDTGAENHIVFVVRDDARPSKVLFQTADTTWQAYNDWGGNSLYKGEPDGRAYKVSYNRPFNSRSTPDGRDFFFGSEYPMVRWLERNGYDVGYTSGIDSDVRGGLIRNHDVFLSVGHDEYWSGAQREHVEAARDAGVNLMFLSGNEVYWKTRWEPSIAPAGAAHRTMVSYKETRANAKIDPSPEWTGTWRDTRFSPPSDGGRPENSLTGTLFTVNCCAEALKVPADDGKMRLWRGTSVATLGAGETATMAHGTLGYEWDEDIDNGFRPAGLVRMSTSTYTVPERLVDFGTRVESGPATHHLTLYRAASGALVFGAGTVQWSWGLDDQHDGPRPAADVRMQQATVNMLADMGVQPATLQSDLAQATASSDSAPPTAVITSPVAGEQVGSGSVVTVTGTASDAGGGRVGAVEVSLDGGQSWHPASGRESWTYSGQVVGNAPVQILARAADDSANLQQQPTAVTVEVGCPCSLFGDQVPTAASDPDTTPIELGVKFSSAVDGWVTGVRFFKGDGNGGVHTGSVWAADGTRLATATFSGETGSGWQRVTFPSAVRVTAGQTYVASYFAPAGRYTASPGYFLSQPVSSPPLTSPQATDTNGNGVYRVGSSGFPTSTFRGGNYWVDVDFVTVEPPDTQAPEVSGVTPLDNASSIPASVQPQVRFTEPIEPGSASVVLRTTAGQAVAAAASLDADRRVLTVVPSAPLGDGTSYVLEVSAARDVTGNTMVPFSSTFRTAVAAPTDGSCPCSIWTDGTQPAIVEVNDPKELELGVKFRAAADGFVNGVRFYKGARNSGTHIGTLWAADGTQLATATFGGESSAGWQQVTFDAPVAVTAGTTYVASYHTTAGFYSATINGLGATTTRGPLSALGQGVDGPNGVYRYGARAFPTSGAGTNYWVDVVFERAPDVSGPVVTGRVPGVDASSVSVSTPVSVTFDEDVVADSVSLVVRGADGAAVPGVSSYDGATRTVTFRPASGWAAGSVFSVAVSGAADAAGNVMAGEVSWSFTTSGEGVCPCTLWRSDAVPSVVSANDSGSVQLGVRFTADVDGFVSGVRFYKGAQNTGTHTGSLWSAGGTRLASGTFTGETASGWQTLTFGNPVPVTAGTVYVAAYHAPNGRYAVDAGYFSAGAVDNSPLRGLAASAPGGNGVFSYGSATTFPRSSGGGANYWVDPVFVSQRPGETTAPEVVAQSPVDGQTSVPRAAAVTALADEAVDGASGTFTLQGPAGEQVPVTRSYDGATRTLRLVPQAPLAFSTTYTATVAEVADTVGNVMAAPVSWSFTTAREPAADGSCPCSVWPDEVVPAVASVADSGAVELGVKFRADVDGAVTGVRFYKGVGNTGTHVGSLWAADGTRLATATFGGESSAGWQQVTFDAPVAVTAGTTYVASYHAPQGRYAATSGGLRQSADAGALHALASGVDGPNGVYRYGSGGVMPTTGSNDNYWVDVVFERAPDVSGPVVTGRVPGVDASSVSVSTPVSVTFDEDVVADSVSLVVRGADGAAVPGVSSYDGATRTVTFRPASGWAAGSVFSVAVSGAADAAGNVMAGEVSWSFTTSGEGVCPCTLWRSDAVPSVVSANDSGSVQLGVRFTADVDGFVSGVRFYKGAQNTGTHTGSLWSAGGTRLASGTFTGETASGWQTLTFGNPVPVTAGTVYVAAYHAPNGRYAVDAGYFSAGAVDNSPLRGLAASAPGGNGVFSYGSATTFPRSSGGGANYWVDPVFVSQRPGETTAPEVVAQSPVDGQTSVPRAAAVTALADEAVDGASGTFTLQGPAGEQVPVTRSYDGATRTLRLVPQAPLAFSTTYTATVAEVADTVGNVMAAPVSWSFTTAREPAADGSCPCSVWPDEVVPAVASVADSGAVELGVKFRADVDGAVTGVRFYKGVGNSGTHVGSLWAADGTRLATATFGGESSAGWQQVTFDAPVAVTAGTTYVASYHAPQGRYAATSGGLRQSADAGALHALASGVDGPNGVYRYGSGGVMPTTGSNDNYWVDVVFEPAAPAT